MRIRLNTVGLVVGNLRRRLRDIGARGAVAIMVGVGMTAFLGFAAMAVDLGNAWQDERKLHTATDAAALAAALTEADGADAAAGCSEAVAEVRFESNGFTVEDGTTFTCTYVEHPSGIGGVVTVEASDTVEYQFAPVLGIDDGTVTSRSRAQWGWVTSPTGLRPLGICDSTFSNLVGGWDASSESGVITVPYNKPAPDASGEEPCGTAPSNWGIIDFDAGANSNSDVKTWLEEGYPGEVHDGDPLGDCDDASAWYDPGACYEGDTGAFSGSLVDAMSYLVSQQTVFGVPLFNDCSAQCNGANAELHIVDFARVRLVGFNATGAASERYLQVVLVPGPLEGGCCGDDSSFGVFGVSLCGFEGSNECAAEPSPTPTATPEP